MRLRDDDRAVTVQVGAVLLLGILVLSMSAYQVTVVPSDNEAVEFEHNQAVQADVLRLQSAVHRAAATGGLHPTTVDLGAQYPRRTFFVNPPPSRGRLSTVAVGDGTVRVSNARALDAETFDYWNGSNRTFDTAALVYRPYYNEYRDAPDTVAETGVVYNQFGDDGPRLPLTNQTLVNGRHVSFALREGNLSAEGGGVRSVGPRGVSVATRTVTVEGGDENVTLRVPTRLDATAWRSLLADEMDTGTPDDGRYVRDVRAASGDAVLVEFEANETYELRIAKVGVGSSVERPGPYYLTRASEASEVTQGEARTVVFEVRDRYNNPVPGARVNVSLDSSVSGDARETLEAAGRSGETIRNLTADGEGRVAVRYVAPSVLDGVERANLTATLAQSAADAPSNATEATVELDVFPPGGEPTYFLQWDLDEIESQMGIASCDAAAQTCTYEKSADSNQKVTLTAQSVGAAFVDVDFSANDSAVVTSVHPTSSETAANETVSTQATFAAAGSAKVIASAVEDTETLTIRVKEGDGG